MTGSADVHPAPLTHPGTWGMSVEDPAACSSSATSWAPVGLSGLKSAVLGTVAGDVVNAYHRPVVLV